jgi:hypothetical protein
MDACLAMCSGQPRQNRIAYACRLARDELPKPTISKWCENGYRGGFQAASAYYANVFTDAGEIVVKGDDKAI